jgi:diadenosine tetraphosphatase ApaH/serine/threonine PP2A family protein phosphatase
VIDLIRDHHIPTLSGNHDLAIGLNHTDFAFSYHTPEEREAGLKAIAYTNAVLTDSNRLYLRSLPKFIRFELEFEGLKTHVLLTHGSPRSVGEYVFEDFPEETLVRIMDEYVADILVMGHTHQPYHRKLFDKAGGTYKHAINAGSVGKPKDGDTRAAYLIINTDARSGLDVEIKRVEYNIQRVQQGIRDSRIPNLYADLLNQA